MTTGFISYTHVDTALKDQLVQHLAPTCGTTGCCDRASISTPRSRRLWLGLMSSVPVEGRADRRRNLLGIGAKPTDLDRDRFLRSGFVATATLFEQNLAELKASDPRIDTDFESIDSRSFAASVYFDGKRVGQISIWHSGDIWRDALCLSYDAATSMRNSMNDWLPIQEAPQGLAFGARNAMSHVRPDGPLDENGAAAYFWESFLNQIRSRIR